jgi:hypothetical protein
MRSAWKVLMIAAVVLVGCGKGDKGSEGDGKKSGGGEQTYTIKIKFLPDVGKAVAIRETEKSSGSSKVSEGGKVLGDQKHDEAKETQYIETLLEVADNEPKKFRRTYEKAAHTQNGKSKSRPYEGKTILFERTADGFKATPEGSAIDQGTLTKLADDVHSDVSLEKALVPAKPVKVNEKWTIDSKTFAAAFGKKSPIDPDKSKGEAKLAKVYDKDGKQFGVIDYEVTLAMKEMGKAMLDPPLMLTMSGSLDAPIDGSSTALNMTLNGKAAGKTQMNVGKKLDMDINMEMTGRKEQSAEMAAKLGG